MVVTIRQQVDRIQRLVQDETETTWTQAKILEQHARELTQLSRQNLFGRIEWVNALAGISQYTLNNVAVEVQTVFYNERCLRYATEEYLDRRRSGWEAMTREPEYWTQDNQSPNVIRVIPAPLRTGSTVPIFPAVPLAQNAVDNLVVFYYEDVGPLANNVDDDFPILDVFEDLAVWRSVEALVEQERPEQDLFVSAVHGQLARLMLQRLGLGVQ